ncbi:hypothetical protein BH24ACI4_BH24ACI4_25460 [soil metagenome]
MRWRCSEGQPRSRPPGYNTATVAHSSRQRLEPGLQQQSPSLEDDVLFHAVFDEESPQGTTGDCVPPMDVIETTEGIEILLDLPGLAPGDIRLVFSNGTLVIAGRKRPAACAHGRAAFHLAERTFGRFVRAVRLTGAVDAGRASARLVAGELRILLPRIDERRGRDIRIPVTGS